MEVILSMAIEPGLVSTMTINVTPHNIAPHVPVFSTPALVQLFEQTCSYAIKDSLPADTTHVGFEVNIRHLGPVPMGGKVEAIVEVTELRGNKVHFKLEARYQGKKIGDGTYSCAIVPSRFGGG